MELKLTNVTKEFGGIKAVDSVNETLGRGVYGLLGVNGAGKTTLMRMLTTLLQPTAGSITWDGEDVFAMEGRYRSLLGYLPQEFGFYPSFTVREYLSYIASIKGLRPAVARDRVKTLLGQVGLTKAANKRMKHLSGGMKRRAGIAQAMLGDPRLLILDEPTAGLDPTERIRFRNLISELSEERVVLLSTHIVSDVEYIADRILLMKDGKITASGTAQSLADTLPERVWLCQVPRPQIEACRRTMKVSNIKTTPQGAQLRILSAGQPMPDALETAPTLEDVFLCHFGQKGGSDDDAL